MHNNPVRAILKKHILITIFEIRVSHEILCQNYMKKLHVFEEAIYSKHHRCAMAHK